MRNQAAHGGMRLHRRLYLMLALVIAACTILERHDMARRPLSLIRPRSPCSFIPLHWTMDIAVRQLQGHETDRSSTLLVRA